MLRKLMIVVALMCLAPLSASTARAQEPFKLEDPGFTVVFPGRPKAALVPLKTAAGAELKMHTWTYNTPIITFFVSYVEYEAGTVAKQGAPAILNRFVTSVAKNRTVLKDRSVTHDGHPGHEVLAQTKDKTYIRIRAIVVDERLYQGSVESKIELSLTEQDRFLDTLKFKK